MTTPDADVHSPSTVTQKAAVPVETEVTLTLTIAQARALKTASDLYVRLSLGQFQEIAQYFAQGEFKVADREWPTGALNAEPGLVSSIRRCCDDIRALANHRFGGSSFSIGSRGVSCQAHHAHEINRVLSQALAVDNDPAPSFRGVDYDGLTVRYEDGPVPRCAINNHKTLRAPLPDSA
jgi:hypothetical protein